MTRPLSDDRTFMARLGELECDVRAGEARDAVDGTSPRFVVEPPDRAALARALALADEHGLVVVPRGGGSKLGLGSPPARVDVVLAVRRLDRIVEHASGDLTATVEAGCTVARLRAALAERGQRLALDPPWPERATIGGVLAANDAGPLRTRFGAARNLVLGMTVVLADGTIAASGGKVVKNVAGYDLPKLMTGALGTLGVIAEVTVRLHPIPEETLDVTFSFPRPEDAAELLGRAAASRLAPACAELRSDGGRGWCVDVRFEGVSGATESRASRFEALAGGAAVARHDGDAWGATERLRSSSDGALVLKVGVLPSEIGAFARAVSALADEARARSSLAVQSDGVGYVRFDGRPEVFGALVSSVRAASVHTVVVDGPLGVKRDLDVWGQDHDAAGLMRRVKERFDPRGTLNRGRFVAGI
jgi:glycolate oxidase FAD binding subunit